MRLKADPDFEEIARCIRLARQEKCPGLRRRLLTLTREWIMLQCMGRRRVLPSMELQAPPYIFPIRAQTVAASTMAAPDIRRFSSKGTPP